MAEGVTRADFERWVEPHLTALAQYAGRRVAPAERDEVVRVSLIRAYQRWSMYDASRATPLAWLLAIVTDESRSHRTRQPTRDVVELVEWAGTGLQTRDVDLERAVDGLGGRERSVVDLHYFVGLDVESVAAVVRSTPDQVEARLQQARDRLRHLVGDDDEMEVRLAAAGRRWQDEQPPPPEVPLQRLDTPVRRRRPERRVVIAAAAALLVGGGLVARTALAHEEDPAPPQAAPPIRSAVDPPAGPRVDPKKVVPFRDLEARHPVLGRAVNGVLVTPYDAVSATGHIEGAVHPGDTLVFDVVLETPGLISLRPCPDYTIAFGTHTTTRRLNCAQVPYFASLVRSTGQVSSFRPVLPAGTEVSFRMHVKVPDESGPQTVLWTLEGPQQTPGFSGIVDVTPR